MSYHLRSLHLIKIDRSSFGDARLSLASTPKVLQTKLLGPVSYRVEMDISPVDLDQLVASSLGS